MKIPFYLVTGFLGSGKTTLLKNILAEFSVHKRIAVIQNEFAPTGTDGAELKRTGNEFKLVEVNNGSVFCVCMLSNFSSSLEKLIKDYQPEMIFLEASGIADPVNIIEILQKEEVKDKLRLANIFAIVDAVNFEIGIKMLTRFKHQIMIADSVLVNKSDIYKGDLSALHKKIRKLNPFAEIANTTFCKLDSKKYLDYDKTSHEAALKHAKKDSDGRPPINACVLRIHDKLSLFGLKSFIFELQKICPRVKGYVNLKDGSVMGIQTVFDHSDLKEIKEYIGPTEVIAFGDKLTPRELRQIFKNHILE